MKPEKQLEVKARLKKSKNDLRGARIDLDASPPLIEDALFHCQQACEKAMKGFLTFHDQIFRKTHDLDILAEACISIDPGLSRALDPSRDLTVFAWEFRYPGDTEAPSADESENYLASAVQVFESMLGRLPQETHPE